MPIKYSSLQILQISWDKWPDLFWDKKGSQQIIGGKTEPGYNTISMISNNALMLSKFETSETYPLFSVLPYCCILTYM